MIITVNKFNRACIYITYEYLKDNFNVEDVGDLTKEIKDEFRSLVPNPESYREVAIGGVEAEYLHSILEDGETQVM